MTATPIAIAFTPNYFVPAATTLKSLLDASTGDFDVICMLTEAIPEEMHEKLMRMGDGRLKFRYLSLRGRLEGLYIDPRYTEAASFRLLLPELLPEYDKIVYVDCDVVIRQDIGKLYRETELGNNWVGAVYEAAIEGQAERFRALGCDPARYFNSGFLLMNLELMRKERVSAKLLEACRVPYLEFPDQDALNQVCQDRVLPLSPIYNSIRTFFIPRYKADFVRQYNEELWDRVQKEGTIHYTGGKPWNIFSVQFGAWWSVFDSLPREIRVEWKPAPRMYRFWKFYRIPLCGKLIDAFRSLKQQF
ncbi:MAG: glycosyltransferase family 8 protein [Bacteroidales bacterium]|nr:glycosyltransferase family 8 protein [Bacteroidales bacterium]